MNGPLDDLDDNKNTSNFYDGLDEDGSDIKCVNINLFWCLIKFDDTTSNV